MRNPIQSTKVSDKVHAIVDFLQKSGAALPEINTAKPSLEDAAAAFYYLNEYYIGHEETHEAGKA